MECCRVATSVSIKRRTFAIQVDLLSTGNHLSCGNQLPKSALKSLKVWVLCTLKCKVPARRYQISIFFSFFDSHFKNKKLLSK